MGDLPTAAAVAAGGALGALARWGCGVALQRWTGAAMPWGTLAVNVVGSFLLGVVIVGARDRWPGLEPWRPVFATGFLGAFTTFSTFAAEADAFLAAGRWLAAGAYLLGSVAAGLVAYRCGGAVAALLPS